MAGRSRAQRRRAIFRVCLSYPSNLLDFLLGPIKRVVRGFATNQAGTHKAEDTTVGSYVFESGVYGSGAWCYASDHTYEKNEVIGEAGRLLFSTMRPTPIQLCRGCTIEELKIDDPPHVHQPLIQTIVDELNGIGKCRQNYGGGGRPHCLGNGSTACRILPGARATWRSEFVKAENCARGLVPRTRSSPSRRARDDREPVPVVNLIGLTTEAESRNLSIP